jgi:hypothetical protein
MAEIGNRDMRIHRCKMTLYSIQSSAGAEKIRPEDGLPASRNNNSMIYSYDIVGSWDVLKLFMPIKG